MSDNDGLVLNYVRTAVDTLAFGIAISLLAVAAAFTLSITTGGGAVRANILLFIFGWVLMAYATFHLWPSSPKTPDSDEKKTKALSTYDETGLQRIVRRFGPVRILGRPPPAMRLSVTVQRFIASLCIFATSFILEVIGGIG